MLKKACATGVLALTAAAGALLTASPASAQAPSWGGGWGGCCGNSNWNNNTIFNHVPVSVSNRNNNFAFATNNQRQDGGLFGGDGLFGLGLDDD